MIFVRLTWNTPRVARPLHPFGCGANPALLNKFLHMRPYNEKIKYTYVQVVNAEGKLDPPMRLSALLASLDLKLFQVQLVTDDRPIVKILNKKQEHDKEKALKKARKAAQRPPEDKEIQMTWGVAEGDLMHKINKARAELVKRNRVDIVFAPKKRQPLPPQAERDAKVNDVLEMLRDVGKECRPRTFHKFLLTLHLQANAMDNT